MLVLVPSHLVITDHIICFDGAHLLLGEVDLASVAGAHTQFGVSRARP